MVNRLTAALCAALLVGCLFAGCTFGDENDTAYATQYDQAYFVEQELSAYCASVSDFAAEILPVYIKTVFAAASPTEISVELIDDVQLQFDVGRVLTDKAAGAAACRVRFRSNTLLPGLRVGSDGCYVFVCQPVYAVKWRTYEVSVILPQGGNFLYSEAALYDCLAADGRFDMREGGVFVPEYSAVSVARIAVDDELARLKINEKAVCSLLVDAETAAVLTVSLDPAAETALCWTLRLFACSPSSGRLTLSGTLPANLLAGAAEVTLAAGDGAVTVTADDRRLTVDKRGMIVLEDVGAKASSGLRYTAENGVCILAENDSLYLYDAAVPSKQPLLLSRPVTDAETGESYPAEGYLFAAFLDDDRFVYTHFYTTGTAYLSELGVYDLGDRSAGSVFLPEEGSFELLAILDGQRLLVGAGDGDNARSVWVCDLADGAALELFRAAESWNRYALTDDESLLAVAEPQEGTAPDSAVRLTLFSLQTLEKTGAWLVGVGKDAAVSQLLFSGQTLAFSLANDLYFIAIL